MPNERISMSKLKQLIGLQASNLSIRALQNYLSLHSEPNATGGAQQ
jgi:hypothetical protein